MIEKLKKEHKIKQNKRKELVDEQLKEILKPTIIYQKAEPKKGGKRLNIANKIMTSDELTQMLVRKREEDETKKNKPKRQKRKKE